MNLGLTLAGREARDNWTDIKDKLHYVDYLVVALILVAAAYFLVRFLKNRRGRGQPAVDAA